MQDLPAARGITDIYEALDLGNVGDGHRLSVIGTQVKKGKSESNSGVQDARDLIIEMMSEDWAYVWHGCHLPLFALQTSGCLDPSGFHEHQRVFKPNESLFL